MIRPFLTLIAAAWLAAGLALCPAAPAAAGAGAGAGQGKAPALAINLAPVNDYSAEQPFIDVMKTARRWIGHKPGQWGGVEYAELEARGILDADGWPMRVPPDLASVGTLILTDLPEEGAAAYGGRYVLRYEGEGIVEVSGAAANRAYAPGEVRFDFTPGRGRMVIVKIQRTDPRGTGDYIRNITVVREDNLAAHAAGEIFNPLWLDRIDGFAMLRFMDWMNTNNSTEGRWSARARVSDFSYGRRGVPVEVMVALANRLRADAWFNMPHLADDDYMARFAALVAERLEAPLKAYVEFSNEVWNHQFAQAEWAEAQARARWGREHRGHEFYGVKAAEMARIWARAFAGQRERLVAVIATQTGWLGLEKDILEAPLYRAEDPAHEAPWQAMDAYAVTGYFGLGVVSERRRDQIGIWLERSETLAEALAEARGLEGAARADWLDRHRFDHATLLAVEELFDGRHSGDPSDSLQNLLGRVLPYHAEVARRHGLELVAYEGGTHVVGHGSALEDDRLTDFFVHLGYAPGIAPLYERLLAGWAELGAGPFALFNDVQAPGKWGSWGHLRHLADDNPRWRAIERFKGRHGS